MHWADDAAIEVCGLGARRGESEPMNASQPLAQDGELPISTLPLSRSPWKMGLESWAWVRSVRQNRAISCPASSIALPTTPHTTTETSAQTNLMTALPVSALTPVTPKSTATSTLRPSYFRVPQRKRPQLFQGINQVQRALHCSLRKAVDQASMRLMFRSSEPQMSLLPHSIPDPSNLANTYTTRTVASSALSRATKPAFSIALLVVLGAVLW